MASGDSTKMVAFSGDLIVFQNQRSTSKCSEISFWKLSFDPESRNFVNKEDRISSMYKNNSREMDIVHCVSVVDDKTKQKVPCVLLRIRKKATQGFKYLLYSLNSSSSARLRIELTLPYDMDKGVSVLRGPTLVWSCGDTVFYTSEQAGGVKEVTVRLGLIFTGELLLRQRELVVLGSCIGNQDEGTKTLLYFLEDGRTLSGTHLFPDAYSAVIRCVALLSAEEAQGSLRSTVLAATCRKQLVRFENGLPEDVCSLPYDDRPLSILIVHARGGGCLVAVVFEHGNVCAVWKDTFKVAASWTGVSSVLVDDFVGCGSEQMLLLFEGPNRAETGFGEFLLTDLSGVQFSSGGEGSYAFSLNEQVQENVRQTIVALERRLQNGLAFQQELQRDICVKDRVLQQTMTALTDLVSGREHVPNPPQREGLVSLWDEESEVEEPPMDERTPTAPEERPPKVQRIWQRVVGEKKLVFGALLTPDADITEETVAASVFWESRGRGSTPAVLQSQSRTLPYPDPTFDEDEGPPAAKRCRESEGAPRLALLTVTDLTPLVTSGKVTCSLLLRSRPSGEGPGSQWCFPVNLDATGMLQGEGRPHLLQDCGTDSDESREDLLSLMAASESWSFRIESSEHTMEDVAGWLAEKTEAERVKVSPQHLLDRTTATLFRWQLCSPFQGLLDVHCSGHLGVLQFLSSLMDFLPSSHHVSLLKTPHRAGRSLALSLDMEMKTLREGVASLLHSREEEEEEEEDEDKEVRGISDRDTRDPACPELLLESRRKAWQKDRERSSRKLRPLVDPRHYRRLVGKAIETQLDGDVAALVEAHAGR